MVRTSVNLTNNIAIYNYGHVHAYEVDEVYS